MKTFGQEHDYIFRTRKNKTQTWSFHLIKSPFRTQTSHPSDRSADEDDTTRRPEREETETRREQSGSIWEQWSPSSAEESDRARWSLPSRALTIQPGRRLLWSDRAPFPWASLLSTIDRKDSYCSIAAVWDKRFHKSKAKNL